jgi:flagellar hook-associated protein 1 FlgK
MSLSSLLSIARSALLTQQRAIDTTGHNIANAHTEGFSRQRLNLAPEVPLKTEFGQVGRGVSIAGIVRFRDQFLDASYRQENGERGRYGMTRDLLGQIEELFGEPSDNGLGAGIDALFSAFGDLANDPAGKAPRVLVREAAASLAQSFNDADRRLSAANGEVVSRMDAIVADINDLTRQIADLNIKAQGGASGQRQAPDLSDERDKLVDQLSTVVGVRVLTREDGTIGVVAGDALLVDGGQFASLEGRDLGKGGYGIGVVGAKGTINMQSGQLAALVELSAVTIPGIRARLDALAAGVVAEVNALHRNGTTLTGRTGIEFFNPTGRTAASMALSSEIGAATDNIAAGQSGGAADNANALAIAALRTTGVGSFGGATIGQAYQEIITSIGVMGREAVRHHEAQDVIANNADAMRKSVSGVSIDEEMTNLITQQNAFAAAARLVSVADQMMQDVIEMVR